MIDNQHSWGPVHQRNTSHFKTNWIPLAWRKQKLEKKNWFPRTKYHPNIASWEEMQIWKTSNQGIVKYVIAQKVDTILRMDKLYCICFDNCFWLTINRRWHSSFNKFSLHFSACYEQQTWSENVSTLTAFLVYFSHLLFSQNNGRNTWRVVWNNRLHSGRSRFRVDNKIVKTLFYEASFEFLCPFLGDKTSIFLHSQL